MPTLSDIVTIPTLLLALGIYIAAFFLRRLLEALWPTLSTKTPMTRAERLWEEFVLPTMPAVLGLLFCLLCPPPVFPYPDVASGTVSRMLYGLVIGWFSAWLYRVAKSILQKKWNIPFPDDSIHPAAVVTTETVIIPANPAPPKVD